MYYLTPIMIVRGFAVFVKCKAYYLAGFWLEIVFIKTWSQKSNTSINLTSTSSWTTKVERINFSNL